MTKLGGGVQQWGLKQRVIRLSAACNMFFVQHDQRTVPCPYQIVMGQMFQGR